MKIGHQLVGIFQTVIGHHCFIENAYRPPTFVGILNSDWSQICFLSFDWSTPLYSRCWLVETRCRQGRLLGWGGWIQEEGLDSSLRSPHLYLPASSWASTMDPGKQSINHEESRQFYLLIISIYWLKKNYFCKLCQAVGWYCVLVFKLCNFLPRCELSLNF